MGFDTFIDGGFSITPPLSPDHAAYLAAFSRTRRMKRDSAKAAALVDPLRTTVGLPVGAEGEFVVSGTGSVYGEEDDEAVVDGNMPPGHQPGLWCGWSPSMDRTQLLPDDDHNRGYLEWLKYLIDTFFVPWGVFVGRRGEVERGRPA